MTRWLFVTTATIVAAAGLSFVRAEDKPAASAPDPQAIQKLIDQLDSTNFAARQNATRQLSEMGYPAIEPVARAVESGSLEVIARSLTILETIYQKGDDRTIDAVEETVERLSQSTNQSVVGRAELVLAKCYPLRERRALAEIRNAGGVFMRLNQANNKENVVTATGGLSYAGLVLHIGAGWKGGDEALKHVKRLDKLKLMRFVPGVSGVSNRAMVDLQASLPDLIVHERGAAKLGLTGQPSQVPRGCEVTTIESGSAAEEAKIEPGDIIVKFEDKPVNDFETLVQMIKAKKPGDKVPLEIVRPREPSKPKVVTPVLKGWAQ